MPVFKGDEMVPTPDSARPHIMMNQFGGELIKAGVVTYAAGDAPPPHVHPTDEQWIYLLEGRLATILGDEMEIIGPGDLVYIPRGIPHGIRLLGPLCRFFTCKSPAGSGALSEDYTEIPNLDDMIHRLDEAAAGA